MSIQGDEVREASTRRDLYRRVLLARPFVEYVFDEEEDEDVVLVLRDVHAADGPYARSQRQ